MDTLKPLDQVTVPDERWHNFGRLEDAGTFARHTLAERHASINEIELSPTAPDPIREHFETAKNLLLYAWFVYRFIPVAELHAYSTVEMALRERAKLVAPKTRNLARLLKVAIERGWIVDEGFGLVRRGRQAAEREREMLKQSGISATPEERDVQRYCKVLMDALPELRNELAHGSHMIHPGGFRTLALCADLINQLFPGKS